MQHVPPPPKGCPRTASVANGLVPCRNTELLLLHFRMSKPLLYPCMACLRYRTRRVERTLCPFSNVRFKMVVFPAIAISTSCGILSSNRAIQGKNVNEVRPTLDLGSTTLVHATCIDGWQLRDVVLSLGIPDGSTTLIHVHALVTGVTTLNSLTWRLVLLAFSPSQEVLPKTSSEAGDIKPSWGFFFKADASLLHQ